MNDQSSLANQLNQLVTLANQNGLYDAADWLQQVISESLPEPKEGIVPSASELSKVWKPTRASRWERVKQAYETQGDVAAIELCRTLFDYSAAQATRAVSDKSANEHWNLVEVP